MLVCVKKLFFLIFHCHHLNYVHVSVYTSFSDKDFPDDGTSDPRDFKFVKWMTKELVSLNLM